MDQEKSYSKKELKAMKRLAELEQKTSHQKQTTIKWLIISVSSLLFLGLFSFILISSKQAKTTETMSIVLSQNGWVRGNDTAKVTLTEFSDFQCPACRSYEPLVQQLLKDYDGKLKLLYKHFPLKQTHLNAMAASRASEAAGAQNKFWEMHDILFEKQDEWSTEANPDEKFLSYAKGLKLDEEKFKADYKLKEFEDKINTQQEEGIKAGVGGTPTFFINGKQVVSGAKIEDMKKMIDEELK